MQRAERFLGIPVSPGNTYVIGDTPRDILHGKEAGARTVGVGTGRSGVEELARYRPDHVFSDFSQTHEVVEYFQDSALIP